MLIRKLPKLLIKPVGRAIADFNMLNNGDKVLLAVSGGKDSLSLFHILQHFQKHAPIDFELAVITIDPQVEGFEPQKLKDYFVNFDVKYFFEEFPIMEQAKKSMKGDSYCAFCARMKRGLMYKVAKNEDFNVLALGQHLDDLAESLFMSMCHNGKMKTMKANYVNDTKDVRIIRPLVYVRERQLADFANNHNLPIIKDNCPACFEMPTQREHFKKLLLNEEKQNKSLYKNLLNAMKPILTND
ncbi:tRNA(Cytosine32)-2-thiocytidine synthetase [hydrothermal vent metagenome]|uniref:tRNA(Cytosine32)-2-thiocytidine synthetase n=1 Tax=hydrothermal vent metagenome TaxID=652676 RepID=A0A1W1CJ00_9ZZZZ